MDKSRKLIFNRSYPLSWFSDVTASWIELPVPSIEVNDKFYVHIYRKKPPFVWALLIASDSSIPNEHSSFAVATQIDVPWPYQVINKSQVNWMVRVVGTYIGTQ